MLLKIYFMLTHLLYVIKHISLYLFKHISLYFHNFHMLSICWMFASNVFFLVHKLKYILIHVSSSYVLYARSIAMLIFSRRQQR